MGARYCEVYRRWAYHPCPELIRLGVSKSPITEGDMWSLLQLVNPAVARKQPKGKVVVLAVPLL
jgi:hypothetical protein